MRKTHEGGDWRERLDGGGRDEDGVMQCTHVSSPGGSSRGDAHKTSKAQVKVDRLAAAPRKTLNRDPAGKIARSQSSQGRAVQPDLWFEHLFTAGLEILTNEPQEAEGKLGWLSMGDGPWSAGNRIARRE